MAAKICDTVLMVRPVNFGFNEETALSNSFQLRSSELGANDVQQKALQEFDVFAATLREHGIEVLEFTDTLFPKKPDSIFPNNWFCTDPSGLLLTFPMATSNRRAERRQDVLDYLTGHFSYRLDESLTSYENQHKYLEGTGSLVIDHKNKLAFAALSPRTDRELLELYSRKCGNEILAFEAFGPEGEAIYHTNVMLCIADDFALVGLDTISPADRENVEAKLKSLGKELILLSNEQIYKHFAGNALQLQNKLGDKFLILSEKAKRCLTAKQRQQIENHHNQIIAPSLDTIETIGGGSARCMLAEIF